MESFDWLSPATIATIRFSIDSGKVYVLDHGEVAVIVLF